MGRQRKDQVDPELAELDQDSHERALAPLSPPDLSESRASWLKRRPVDFRKYTHQIWLAGLGAFSRAENERSGLFDSLVKVGEELESRTTELAESTVDTITDRVQETYDRVERTLDDRVNSTASRLGLVSQRDWTEMLSQLEAQQRQLDRIESMLKQLCQYQSNE